MTEHFLWAAHYSDDTILCEIDEAGQSHGFAEIDQSRLRAFALHPLTEGLKPIVLQCSKQSRPIFFRRKQIHIDPVTDERTQGATIHVIGWQQTVKGVNVKSFVFIFEDGSMVVSDEDTF